MGVLLAAVPSRRDPHAEDQVAGHVEEQYQQEPPDLDLEVQVGLVPDVDPDQIETHGEGQQQDERDALEEHEEQHGGNPTAGAAR
jgi:hypothetical protein